MNTCPCVYHQSATKRVAVDRARKAVERAAKRVAASVRAGDYPASFKSTKARAAVFRAVDRLINAERAPQRRKAKS